MMTFRQVLASIFVVFLSFSSIQGQDIHFSQFYMSPLNLNPAMTGVMNCTERFVANYRNQWATYNTFSASYDRKIPVGRADYFGIGGTLWGDIAGDSKFGTTQARMSFSFSKQLSGSRNSARYLVAGLDAGITQRRISTGDLIWPAQHDGNGGINGSIPGETIENPSFIYPDVAGGLLYFDVLDKRNSYYLGVAMHHLNKANVSFQNGEVSLFSKLTIHGGGEFQVGRSMSMLPGFVVFLQGPHEQYHIGTSFRFGLAQSRDGNSQSFQLGAWYRAGTSVVASNPTESGGTTFGGNALILSSRFDYERYGFGLSYDISLNSVNTGGGAGSFEFSMIYLICGKDRRGVYCPTF